MAAKISNPGTQTFDAPREHASFRLDPRLIAIIEDIAMGVEAGDAGLKSCAMGAVSAAALGASAADVNAAHHQELAVIDDEDECFNAIGDLLAKGFAPSEVAKRVALGGGATHLLALERWCDRVRLTCDLDHPPAEALEGFVWEGSSLHERRRRGHRAMAALRATGHGITHASVLHIVYGWPDPFVSTLPAEVRVALGRELAPLARYTDAVEARRQELARAEAARDARTASEGDGALPLGDYRERLARAERCLTSGDGLRAGTGAFAEAMPIQGDTESTLQWEARKDARKARRLEHEGRVEWFVTTVKLDANRMLTEASTAFFGAWLAS